MTISHGLYAILDVDVLARRGVDAHAPGVAESIASALLSARPVALQLRAKSDGARATLALLRRIAPLARGASVPFFANDRPDLALLAEADGVHVGQDDLPLEDVRRIAPGLRLGVSTHDLAQLSRALDARPDYVAFGPVFGTSSKANPDPVVGLEGLRAAAARAREAGVPLVAIGGVDRARARAVADAGATAGAVISDLLNTNVEVIAARASELQAALARVPESRG